jgi:hypothetical protein
VVVVAVAAAVLVAVAVVTQVGGEENENKIGAESSTFE